MYRIIYFVLIVILVSTNIYTQIKQELIPWPTLSNSAWPMIKHDPQFTGRSPYKGPQTPTIVWTADLPHGIFSGPVLDIYQNLYFGSYYQGFNRQTGADHFFSYTTDGMMNWDVRLGSDTLRRPPQTGILIDSSNTIYFGSLDGYFYALNMDGSVKWKYQTEPMVEVVMPNIDLEGNLYIINGKSGELLSIHPDGTLNWKVTYGDGFIEKSPVFSPDGKTIYIFGKLSNLYAINLDGSLKWQFNCGKASIAPIVDNNGNLYFVTEDVPQCLISLKPDGAIRWRTIIVSSTPIPYNSAPTIDNFGNIYLALGSAILSYDNNGNKRWWHIIGTNESEYDDFWQPLICDNEGTVYVGSTFGKNYYAISSEGKLKWQLPFNDYQVDNTGAIGEDGTLYIGVHKSSLWDGAEKNLIAIRDTGAVGVEKEVIAPLDFRLMQNYPNPFNPSTTINYQIPSNSFVTLKVYDVLGNEVATLVNEWKEPGSYNAQFTTSSARGGKQLASGMSSKGGYTSGVYFYTLTAGKFTDTKKLILLK
ncbi:MAG: PQQ-binding-like beta-propeller repeat protein [Ignavibacteria bacterium]|nr:PQQ-binding-like beta-propeller repeat protein [Ignavibacteria bacterium]